MDINSIRSDLKMEHFHFIECSITRKTVIENGPLKMDLKKEISKKENGIYTVLLELSIKKEPDDLNVKVIAAADFYMDSEDKELVEKIMDTNTVAIMFPFIRSQVSLLTTQPGMTPIILPPINTANFKNN